MQWSFSAVGPVHADIEVPSGRVTVQPQTGDALDVSLEPARHASAKGADLIEQSDVRFEHDKLTVYVPSRAFKNTALLCTVSLPEGSSLKVKTASADVMARLRLATFTAATASGDIAVGDVEGDVDLTCASGDFRCENIGGRLRVKGASSDVTAGRIGGEVDIALASGDVTIDDAGASVTTVTASGDVQINCAHQGRLAVNSASGDIVIGIAKGAGAHLDVSSVSGDVSSSLPVDESAGAETVLEIKCRTMSGDVVIKPGG